MVKYRVAASLSEKTVGGMWNSGLRAILQGADILELGLGCLNPDQLDDKSLDFLMSRFHVPIIITNRHRDGDQSSQGLHCPEGMNHENERTSVLQKALTSRERQINSADFVEIELKHYRGIERDPSRTKLILSWYDFNMTPNYESLESIYQSIANLRPDIVKIATMVNHTEDSRRIINLIRNNRGKMPLIAIGLGELGVETRIMGPELGAYLTYACLNGRKASPGQITIKELYEMWGIRRS